MNKPIYGIPIGVGGGAKFDEFHNLTSTNEFDESKLPTEIYYKVIEPEWINTETVADESQPFEVADVTYVTEETIVESWTHPHSEPNNHYKVVVPAGSAYQKNMYGWYYGEIDSDFDYSTPIQKITVNKTIAMIDENGKLIQVSTTRTDGESDAYGEGGDYITVYTYEDGSPVTAPLTLYPIKEVTCYDFENLQFTTEPEGNTLLGDVYSYEDKWGNRCYTLYLDYTPNIKSGTATTNLTENDPENMLYSIKLEALFNGDYKYSLGNGDFSFLGGKDVIADGLGAVAAGRESFAIGNSASTHGTLNKVRAQSGIALGYNNIVTGRHGVALNEGNKVLGYAALGFGDHNTIIGSYGLAGGQGVRIFADTSIGYGSSIDVYSRGSLVGGSEHSNGDGFGNIVWGKQLTSGGYENAIFGSGNTSTGMANIIGGKTNDIGLSSFNIVGGGSNTISSDNCYYNILGGSDNTLSNSSSRNIVGGYKNKLDNASMNIVGGREHEINAQNSIILGMGNYIKGSHGGAIGQGLNIRCVNGVPNFGIGRYNFVDWKENLFTIGNGTSDSNRSNALVVKNDGRTVLGADPVEAMDAVTKQYLDNKVKEIVDKLSTAITKILKEQNSIISIQNELIVNGEIHEILDEILTTQESYIGGET